MKTNEGNIWKARSHADRRNGVAYIQGPGFAKHQALPTRCTGCFVSQLVRKSAGFDFSLLCEILVMTTSKPKPLTSTSSIINFEVLVTLAKNQISAPEPLLRRLLLSLHSGCAGHISRSALRTPRCPGTHLQGPVGWTSGLVS